MNQNKSKTGEALLAMIPHLSPVAPGKCNLVFSPLSLQVVLSLAAAGATRPAAAQILALLRSDSVDDLNALSFHLISKVLATSDKAPQSSYYFETNPPEISFVNGVWIHDQLSLKHSFKQVVDDVFQADLYPSDFLTKAKEIESQVNSWASEETHGLIPNILERDSVKENDKLILVNALYFKASWDETYFNESATKDNDFYLLDNTSVQVPFMTNNGCHLYIGVFDDFKVLSLFYEANRTARFRMYIFLPNSVDGLAAMEARVASEPDFIERYTKVTYSIAEEFRIPKFKISFGFEADPVLKQFGMTLPFTPGSLSGMVEGQNEELFVSGIFQKAVIEVNEKGTLAAAVTAMKVSAVCSMEPLKPKKTDFVADHPFMFLIKEEWSGAVLFLGHILNPQ